MRAEHSNPPPPPRPGLGLYLTATLANRKRYAIPFGRSRGIIGPMELGSALAAYRLRWGRDLPIVDLAWCLGLGKAVIGKRSCIVLVERSSGEQAGLLVDAVNALVTVAPDYFDESRRCENPFLTGKAQAHGHTIFFIDIDQALHEAPERAAPEQQWAHSRQAVH